MIDREPEHYKNRLGNVCKYPRTKSIVYQTGETEDDKNIARQISTFTSKLKGIQYLQVLKLPDYLGDDEEKGKYIKQRFTSAVALAGYMVRSDLRSSHCALYEYLFGTAAANDKFSLKSTKNPSGNIISKIKKCMAEIPKKYVEDHLLEESHKWLYNDALYKSTCEEEIKIYQGIGSLLDKLSGNREERKAQTLIENATKHKKLLAFDSTVITLDYLNKLITEKQDKIRTIVAAGHNTRNRNQVKEIFALGNHPDEKLIALCSDAMAEGINLQDGSCLVLLDMPSVLRIIEQRIGRLDRMDCQHEEITILWPDDSVGFSLKGDKRMIDILMMTENLIGNNVDIPKPIYEKYLKDNLDTNNIIEAFKEYTQNDHEWEGVKDSTQSLYSLIEGRDAIIDKETYDLYKDVDATVKTAISFIETDKNWSFFAFRGNSSRSPKWLFVDEKNNSFTDFAEVSNKLRQYLNEDNIVQRKWNEIDTPGQIQLIIRKLRRQQKKLLPWKKKRALEKGENILKVCFEKVFKSTEDKEIAQKLLSLFNTDADTEEYVDLDHFADLWLTILIPKLDKLRNDKIRKRKLYTLRDLSYRNVKLTTKDMEWMLSNCQYTNTLDEMISACIIGIKKESDSKNLYPF